MAEFVRGVESFREDTLAVLALKLTLQTVVRTNEIRFAAWDEFEGDVWRIPAGRMKEGLEHIVPLSWQTLALLQEIPRRGALLFSKDTKSGVISQNAMISICYRLGYMSKMTVHGIRRTFSTAANESGLWQPDAVERQLAHVEQNDVRRAYNAAEYMDERRRLVQWWNDTLFPDWGDMLG
nr:site-specific integrase [Sphingomonas sp. TREG-RG-20F-R18-01]